MYGELDTLAQLIKAALLKSEESPKKNRASWWTAKLLEHGVQGIQVNTQTDRKVDTVLASLIAALVAFGGNAPRENADAPIATPSLEDLSSVLRLLARLTPPVGSGTRTLSRRSGTFYSWSAGRSEPGNRSHAPERDFRRMGPRDAEKPQPYLLRLSEILVLEFIGAEFYIGQISPQAVRASIFKLADVLVTSGTYKGPHSSQHFSHAVHGMGFRETPRKAARTFLGGNSPRARNRLYCGDKKSGACRFRRCGRRSPSSPTRASTRHAAKQEIFF